MYNPNVTPYTPGNIDDTTRMLIGLKEKGQLQQYVQQHASDPNLVALALYVNNLDSAVRGQQAQQQAQQMQGQPTVVEERIAQMSPPVQLPEEMGIGALPAPNMEQFADGGIVGYSVGGMGPNPASGPAGRLAYDNEPVLKMAGGGMVAFGDGGVPKTDKKQDFATKYRGLAEQVGQELGVSPGIIIAQWGHESDWGRKPVGQYNFGNIKDTTGKGPTAYDRAEKSRSSYRSYDTPEQFAQDYTRLIKTNFPNAVGAGDDVGAFSAGLRKGKYGAYATDEKYGEKLGRTVSSLIPSVQAATPNQAPAQPAVGDSGFAKGNGVPVYDPKRAEELSRLPTSTTPRREAGMWESIKDYYDSPTTWEGVKRNIENTMNALGGWSSPVSMAGKGVGQASKGLEATEEMARKAAELKGAAVGPRALPAVRAGETMSPEMAAAREALKREEVARNAAADAAAARNAEQAVKAADETAAAARAMEEGIAAGPRVAGTRSTQLSTAARGMSAANAMADEAGLPALAAAASDLTGDDQYNPDVKQGLTKAEIDRVLSGNKDAAAPPTAAQQMREYSMFEDPMFLMGMRLLAGKSPHWAQNFGEAGMGTASDMATIRKNLLAEKKEEREAASETGLAKLREAQARLAGEQADWYSRGGKDPNDVLNAEKLVADRMNKWSTGEGKLAVLTDPNAAARKEAEIRSAIYAQLGLTPTMGAAPAPAGNPAGFKLLGVR